MAKDQRRLRFGSDCLKQLRRLVSIYNRLDKLHDEAQAQLILMANKRAAQKKVTDTAYKKVLAKIQVLEDELNALHEECFIEVEEPAPEEEVASSPSK